MRPLELRLRGFRSYSGQEEQRFDFRGRNLIAIVGPTGAGKSTILDAVSLALYGRTPRIGKATSTLINQRAKEAVVSLRFAAQGAEWEAVRHIRRKAANEPALYRFDDANSREPTEKWVMKGAVDAKILELLGLDFGAFSRSVLLAQGKFDEFLGAGDADKSKVLKGLFGFERLDAMKQLAKIRVQKANNEIKILGVQLGVAEQAQTKCEQIKKEIKDAKARQKQLEDAGPEFEKLDKELLDIRQAMSNYHNQHAGIENLKLPDYKKSEKMIRDAEQAEAIIAEAVVRLENASQVATMANAKIKSPEFQKRYENCQKAKVLIGGLEGLQQAYDTARQRATDATQKLKEAKDHLDTSCCDLKSAEDELSKAKERDKKAKQANRSAQDALMDAIHQNMAAELRSGLEEGGDCPVCDQPVHDVPSAITIPGVSQVTEEVTKADEESDKAIIVLQGANGVLQAAIAHKQGAKKI